jgi:hypothetical protein
MESTEHQPPRLRPGQEENDMEEKILEVLLNIVMNAQIGPDIATCGETDCYHVPIDDVEAAKKILEEDRAWAIANSTSERERKALEDEAESRMERMMLHGTE